MSLAIVLLLAAASALPAADDVEFFEKKIRPIFAVNCAQCHSGKTRMGGIDLSAPVSGDVPARILAAIGYAEKVKMPPAGRLPAEQIDDLARWVGSGARWPDAAPAPVVSKPATSSHRSFQPIKDPTPPAVKNASRVESPIDRFILAKLEEKGIGPAPKASKIALIRRVTQDLTGLPPTPREVDEFLADDSPGAFARLTDRLLASPRYGERWGRHWLDVARYADSTGMDEDHLYPHAWRYRDWVIDAFNRDLPFDQMIVHQIAGDLLPAPPGEKLNREGTVATGFLAVGPKPLAQQDRVKMVYDVIDEQIDVTSKAFLGVTLSCARCHDHKFDPFTTRDYYSLAGIFASTKNFRDNGRPGAVSYIYYAPLDLDAWSSYQKHRRLMYDTRIAYEKQHLFELNAHRRQTVAVLPGYLAAAREAASGSTPLMRLADERKLDFVALDRIACYLAAHPQASDDELRQAHEKSASAWEERLTNWLKRYQEEVRFDRALPDRPAQDQNADPIAAAFPLRETAETAALDKQWRDLESRLPPEPPLASAVTDGDPVEQRVFVRGDHHTPGEPAPKRMPAVLAGDRQPQVSRGSGRLELAQWLASSRNPLTARVIVNRVWQWHFGEGLVRTPNNWGATGERPTHPELLDFLASRFIESGWSLKALHRMILASSTYQMDSMATEATRQADPANRLFSRFNRQRLSVEQIRDSLLAIDGSLDPALGGSLLDGKRGRRQATPDESLRRSIYVPVRRGSLPAMFAAFDYGDATTSGEGRTRTTVAPQALFLMNSDFVAERSRSVARGLLAQFTTDADRVAHLYRLVFSRPPRPVEADDALSYVHGRAARAEDAWQSLARVLMSSNEFLYLD